MPEAGNGGVSISPAAPAYVMLGTIGSGKTVQAHRLRDEINAQSLSVGSLIRHHLVDDPRVARGELLPHEEVVAIVTEAMTTVDDMQPVIFDGFPRVVEQKTWLDQYLTQHNRPLAAVFYLKVDETEINKRLAQRGRADDTPQAIARRKRWFEDHVTPVLESYQSSGHVVEIDGNRDQDAVFNQIVSALEQGE